MKRSRWLLVLTLLSAVGAGAFWVFGRDRLTAEEQQLVGTWEQDHDPSVGHLPGTHYFTTYGSDRTVTNWLTDPAGVSTTESDHFLWRLDGGRMERRWPPNKAGGVWPFRVSNPPPPIPPALVSFPDPDILELADPADPDRKFVSRRVRP